MPPVHARTEYAEERTDSTRVFSVPAWVICVVLAVAYPVALLAYTCVSR